MPSLSKYIEVHSNLFFYQMWLCCCVGCHGKQGKLLLDWIIVISLLYDNKNNLKRILLVWQWPDLTALFVSILTLFPSWPSTSHLRRKNFLIFSYIFLEVILSFKPIFILLLPRANGLNWIFQYWILRDWLQFYHVFTEEPAKQLIQILKNIRGGSKIEDVCV